MDKKTIKPKTMCYPCRYKLVHKSKFKKTDPWMSLEMMCTLMLVTRALRDNKFLIKYGNDVEGINNIQCLGCFLPKVMDEVITMAKEDKTLTKLKAEIDKAQDV